MAENKQMANSADASNSLKSGQGLSDFTSGFNRRRGGMVGRFSDGQDPSGLKGTYYRDGMPSPIQGGSPKLSSFADKSGRGKGVNFFAYGAGIKGSQDKKGGGKMHRGSTGENSGLNDDFSGGSTISGFTTKISRGMSQYSDFGADNAAVGETAKTSHYRSGSGQFDLERYQTYNSSIVGTQGSGGSGNTGVLGNTRQGVK